MEQICHLNFVGLFLVLFLALFIVLFFVFTYVFDCFNSLFVFLKKVSVEVNSLETQCTLLNLDGQRVGNWCILFSIKNKRVCAFQTYEVSFS